MITERDLSSALTTKSAARGADAEEASDDRLSTLQRRQVERVLEETGGNKSEAARRLGISRRALYRRIDEMNLTE
jgi:two-component system response regulator HydG